MAARASCSKPANRIGGRAWTDREFFGVPVDWAAPGCIRRIAIPGATYAVAAGFEVIERSPHWQRRIGREEASPAYTAAWRAAFARNEELISKAAQEAAMSPSRGRAE